MICLNECVYYDEIANAFTRLLHESRDYIATLKHYGLPVPIELDSSGVMTLDQIMTLTGITISGLCTMGAKKPTGPFSVGLSPMNIKIKPKLNDELEERRQALQTGACTTLAQQHMLHVMSGAALAGAATMLHCLPPSPQPLNPVVKPLMEAIKREENEELQKLAAKHLARLVDACVDRKPSPNMKVKSICGTKFLCLRRKLPFLSLGKYKCARIFD